MVIVSQFLSSKSTVVHTGDIIEDIPSALVDAPDRLSVGVRDSRLLHVPDRYSRRRTRRVSGNTVAHRHARRHLQVRHRHTACQGSLTI